MIEELSKHDKVLINESIPNLPKDTFFIPQCGLYIKKEETLAIVLEFLERLGYEVESTKDSGSLFAKLSKDVLCTMGKCRSCNSLISHIGIMSHGRRCEKCGESVYLMFQRGSIVRFYFKDDNSFLSVKMRVFAYDEKMKSLILYPDPVDDGNTHLGAEMRKILARNKNKWRWLKCNLPKGIRKHIRKLKSLGKTQMAREIANSKCAYGNRKLIVIKYDVNRNGIQDSDFIELADVTNSKMDFKMVKVYQSKEYSDFDRLPIPEHFMVYKAWSGYPLARSVKLHEKILRAAGMVSREDYYGSGIGTVFLPIHFYRMKLFVENLTVIDKNEWGELAKRTSKSGVGFIRTLSAFCRGEPLEESLAVGRRYDLGQFASILGR